MKLPRARGAVPPLEAYNLECDEFNLGLGLSVLLSELYSPSVIEPLAADSPLEGIGASGRLSSMGHRAHYVPKACPRAIVGGAHELLQLVSPSGMVRSPPHANSYVSQWAGGRR